MFTKRYVNILGVLIGVAVVISMLLYSGCGMTRSPNTPASPTPTPDTSAPTSIITSPTAGATVLPELRSASPELRVTPAAGQWSGSSVGGRRRYL